MGFWWGLVLRDLFSFFGGKANPKVSSKPCGGVLILKNPQITNQVIQMESSLGKKWTWP